MRIITERYMNLSNEYVPISQLRKKSRNKPNFQFILKMPVKCIWHECTLTDIKREWIWHKQESAATSLHRSARSSTFRPSWRWHLGLSRWGEPMKSNRRANPLQATPRVVPGRLVLENDGATSRSNWPAELRLGQTRADDDDPFNSRSHMTGPRPLFIPYDRMARPEVIVVQMRNHVSAMHFYATTANIQLRALCSRLDRLID